MSRRAFFENQLIAAGERVLGKRETFPPVAFYLCKNGQGDISTPWVLSFAGRGSDPCLVESWELARKIAGQGSDPRLKMTATNGYINIQLSDNYILQVINELAVNFDAERYKNIRPDDCKRTFLQDYLIYRAVHSEDLLPVDTFGDKKELRRLGVLIVYGDITGNVENLKEYLYFLARQGVDPRPGFLMAAAHLLARQGADPRS